MDGMIDGYLEKGEYYNAQMMYKTLAFRHKKRGAYGEAVALLCVGAERLLRAQQYLAGSELGQLMVQVGGRRRRGRGEREGERAREHATEKEGETSSLLHHTCVQMYMEAKYPETDELVGKVVALSEMFPCEQYEQQKIFLLTAIKWSASTRTVAREGLASLKAAVPYPGHPLLFRTLGMREVQLGWLLAAEDHFIKGIGIRFVCFFFSCVFRSGSRFIGNPHEVSLAANGRE